MSTPRIGTDVSPERAIPSTPPSFSPSLLAQASGAQLRSVDGAVRGARDAIRGFDTGALTRTNLEGARKALVDTMGSGLPEPLQANQESLLRQLDRRLEADGASRRRAGQDGAERARHLGQAIRDFDAGRLPADALRQAGVDVGVLSYSDIAAEFQVRTVGVVSLDRRDAA